MKPNLATPAGANVAQEQEPLPAGQPGFRGTGLHANKLPGHAAINSVIQKQGSVSVSGGPGTSMPAKGGFWAEC